MKTNERYIDLIRTGKISSSWLNAKAGGFEYSKKDNLYRFIETTPNLNSYLIAESKRTEENCPALLHNFIAFLIYNWRINEINIYDGYYNLCRNCFLQIETQKPGSFKRNLESEFHISHIKTEKEVLSAFIEKFNYIPVSEIKLIIEFTNNYLEYIERYSNKKTTIKKEKENQDFIDYLYHPNKVQLLIELHSLLDNKSGKIFSIAILALKSLGYLAPCKSNAELHRVISKEFGNIGSPQNFSFYLNPQNEWSVDKEIESMKEVLQKI